MAHLRAISGLGNVAAVTEPELTPVTYVGVTVCVIPTAQDAISGRLKSYAAPMTESDAPIV